VTSLRTRRARRATAATVLAAALIVAGQAALPAFADDPVELIANGSFDTGTAPWYSYGTATAGAVVDGKYCADVAGGLANAWDAGIGQNDLTLVAGGSYTFTFTASASAAASIKANVQLGVDPYTSELSQTVSLGDSQTYTYTFTAVSSTDKAQVAFQLGGNADPYTICLDDISLLGPPPGSGGPTGAEQLTNGTFDDGTAPWWFTANAAATVTDGQLCATIADATVNPWDAIIGQNDVHLTSGSTYQLSFDAKATKAVTVLANVQLADSPYTQQLSRPTAIGTELAHYTYTFTADSDSSASQVAFQIGGSAGGWTLCLDNVSLKGGAAPEVYKPDTGPRVRVNQVGYLPAGPKRATLVTDATAALPWQLKNAAGTVVASGNTVPAGVDASSNQNVQTIDFTSVKQTGTGFTLVADGETSFPFTIAGNIYTNLRSDALQFFYLQRSGIAIDGSIVGDEKYTRAAGHIGVAPNQGDTDVPCQAGVCDYRLDVRGGWYDAGDHGKYVVNGGIATYQLLSEFERSKTATDVVSGGLADSTLRLPERGNGVPDVLDEARWELDFLLRMQVPAGQPFAGMAHHKIHDQAWTGLPLDPAADPQPRELHPVSTAATLNLAAVAAQAARLYPNYDAAFATKALAAAKTAYAAAKANPAKYATGADGNGGGAYDDSNVTDEFYWAAAELFITTGDTAYLADLKASSLSTGEVFSADGFGWQSVGALGRLDLATVPNLLPAADRAAAKASVVAAADAYLTAQDATAYGTVYNPPSNHYVWGSNSAVLNNVVVIATAYDLTGAAKYRDGVVQGVDYLFGRNALNHTYVTNYGEVSPQNQHSRMFAHQLNADLPNPPTGSLAGGPNVDIQDPLAAKLLKGCVGQFCYIDDIQSYATNEVAINWNSALAWVGGFLADLGDGKIPAAGSCKVTYEKQGEWGAGFISQITVKNTGTKAIKGWQLDWNFTGGQQIDNLWSASYTQSGGGVTAKNLSWNATINPGKSVTFGFTGTTSNANPSPELFKLNGAACS
jgi:endoglucanase